MSERITQELRDAMNVDREYTMGGDVVTRTYCMGRDEFADLCDAIDAVHNGLERENDRLKCELDRVLGELDEVHKTDGISDNTSSFMHDEKRSIGSAVVTITDELRKWAEGNALRAGMSLRAVRDQALAIADRIDAEHEAACAEAYGNGVMSVPIALDESAWVKLPKDADDEYIRIGDAVTCGATVWTVTGLKFLGEGWGVCCTVYNECGGSGTSVYPPSNLRHHHEPTVEDVLREIVHKCQPTYSKDGSYTTGLTEEEFAEYASKLQLRGDAE